VIENKEVSYCGISFGRNEEQMTAEKLDEFQGNL